MLQLGEMFGAGAGFSVADFGHAPHPVAEFDETGLDCVDAAPDLAAVVHLGSSSSAAIGSAIDIS